MDRDLYKIWHDHPLRWVLRRAVAGDHVHDDQLQDLRLPPKLEAATRQAIDEVKGLKQIDADRLSAELVAALPEHHETRTQHEERRAIDGDADALANIKAREEATGRMADAILRDTGAHT